MRRLLLPMLFAALALPLSATAAEIADYRFENTLQSSILGARPLQALGDGGGFVDAVVNGRNQRAWHVDERTGFELDVAGLVPANRYTLVMQIAPDQLGGYQKIGDMRDRQDDGGLYLSGDSFVTYPYMYQSEPLTDLLSGVFYTLVLTRAPGGQAIGYVDGIEEFRIDDIDNVLEIASGRITLFRDDDVTGDDEIFTGTIARIRVFDEVLTPAQVAALVGSTRIFRGGFEPIGGQGG